MDNQNDKLEAIEETEMKVHFNSENFKAVFSKEDIETDQTTLGSSYRNKFNINFELNDKKKTLNAGGSFLFFREENCSEKEKRLDYSLNGPNLFHKCRSEIVDNKCTELRKSSIPTTNDYIKVSDPSRGDESFFGYKEESKYLANESLESESSQSDGQEAVYVSEARTFVSDNSLKGDFVNNKIGIYVSNSNNDDSVDAYSANTDDLTRTSTRGDSWKKETSLIEDSFQSDANTYSNETFVVSRDLPSKIHVGKLTEISVNDKRMDSGNCKPIIAQNNNSIPILNLKSAVEQVATDSSFDVVDDSIDNTYDSDESFSWYYNQPEDFIEESERSLVSQDEITSSERVSEKFSC